MPFSGFQDLDPAFAAALQALIKAYPGISINSGYRTPEQQAVLYQKALAKYGSEAEARRHVAPPGHSQHNFRTAADLAYADEAAKQAAHAHAGEYKLNFPMSWEDWHIEPVGARQALRHVGGAGSAPSNFNVTPEEETLPLADALAAATSEIDPIADRNSKLISGASGILGGLGGLGGSGGGDIGGGVTANGDIAVGDMETQAARPTPEALAQPWETGARQILRNPKDLGELFAIKQIGLAEQLGRKAP